MEQGKKQRCQMKVIILPFRVENDLFSLKTVI